jgi:hypothetical protein
MSHVLPSILTTDTAFIIRTDEVQKATAYLNDALVDPKSGSSLLPQDAPFHRAHKCSVFDYYGPDKKRRDVSKLMVSQRR